MQAIAFDAQGRPLSGRLTFHGVVATPPDRLRAVQLRAVQLRPVQLRPVQLREQPLLPQVAADVAASRLAVCQACDKAVKQGDDQVCVACSCGSDRRLERLVTRPEAGAVKWCRHPRRGSGAGWVL